MTNADYIRSLTDDEELAKYLKHDLRLSCEYGCDVQDCVELTDSEIECCYDDCEKAILYWLEQEREDKE